VPSHRLAVRVLVAGALTGSSTVLVASPTTAADTWTTTVVALPSRTTIDFGETIDVDADVDVDSEYGSAPAEGTTTLLARRSTSTKWRAVATSSTPSADFPGVKPRMNTSYKVVYGGYEADSPRDDSYEPSESGVFTVEVARTITYPSGGFDLAGRVKPRYGNKKIVIRVSRTQESGYVRYKAIRTDDRGRYSITLPRRKGTWFWSFRVKGDARYLPTRFEWKTWVS
jgi:hypothetical protein